MLNLEELKQLVAFAEHGTLSRAAEELHISQPTITRTMQHLEDVFGVPLFEREKNRITLTATGNKAVEYARNLLRDAETAVESVQTYHRALHTISVEACAPAPVWNLLPQLSGRFPDLAVSSRILPIQDVLRDVAQGQCDIGILPCPCPDETLVDSTYLTEGLSVCVPVGHALYEKDALTLQDLNGFNCLLRDEIGFWAELCYQAMPASRFLVQTDEFEFLELVKTSTLLCFTTNLARGNFDPLGQRKIIPLTDVSANVTYHLIAQDKRYLSVI